MIRFRRFVCFVIMLPIWPLALVAAIVDDEGDISNVIEALKIAWRRINDANDAS